MEVKKNTLLPFPREQWKRHGVLQALDQGRRQGKCTRTGVEKRHGVLQALDQGRRQGKCTRTGVEERRSWGGIHCES
jgi:hypothetical protein